MPDQQAPFTRRQFLDYLIGGGILTALLTFLGASLSFLRPRRILIPGRGEPVEVARLENFQLGSSRAVIYNGQKVLVIRPSEGEVVALAATCTHLGCLVEWRRESGDIHCPCHDAVFDLRGNVLAGPPPRPLPTFSAAIRGDAVLLGSEHG